MKMTFHFIRIPDADILAEGATPGECLQKALELRTIQCNPTNINGRVVADD